MSARQEGHRPDKRGARRVETDVTWDGKQWVVTLLFDEWTQLGATRWAVNEALEARTAVTHRIGE